MRTAMMHISTIRSLDDPSRGEPVQHGLLQNVLRAAQHGPGPAPRQHFLKESIIDPPVGAMGDPSVLALVDHLVTRILAV